MNDKEVQALKDRMCDKLSLEKEKVQREQAALLTQSGDVEAQVAIIKREYDSKLREEERQAVKDSKDSLEEIRREHARRMEDKRAFLEREYSLKIGKEKDRLGRKPTTENVAEQKLNAKLESDDHVREQKR